MKAKSRFSGDGIINSVSCLIFTFGAFMVLMTFCPLAVAQSAGTGAITGTVTDPQGSLVPKAQITVTNRDTGAKVIVRSQSAGAYTAPSLLPGVYKVEVAAPGFKTWVDEDIHVNVTETESLNIKLELGSAMETEEVTAEASPLQLDSTAQGSVVDGKSITTLPLAVRNYTQIVGLDANVSVPSVTRADQLGRGSDLYAAGISVNGVPSFDNNTQMDGVEINDREQSANSAGVAIPNPDSIDQFRVQTGQYDATFGRDAGANVNVVTKGGSNELHGAAWEYFRDTVLNANDFFLNRSGQPRAVLNQNQFGGDFGLPIIKNKLLFFASYQGTRQKNGYSSLCLNSLDEMQGLTDDNRAAAGLGAAFGGRYGWFAGTQAADTLKTNGSNIPSQPIAILNLKLPNGSYLFPTPPPGATTVMEESSPLTPAVSWPHSVWSVSEPCTFNEDQWMTNGDYIQSNRSKFSARFFSADDGNVETEALAEAVPGTPVHSTVNFRNFSLAHDYTFSSQIVNHAQFGFHRTDGMQQMTSGFEYSAIGATVPSFDNDYPTMDIGGAIISGQNGGNVIHNVYGQNTYDYSDILSYQLGKNFLRFGGGITHYHMNRTVEFGHTQIFETIPDFLLGACGGTTALCPGTTIAGNGSGTTSASKGQTAYGAVSNFDSSGDEPALNMNHFVSWGSNLFVQDDVKLTPRLTFNLGLRYDREGYLAEKNGMAVGFNPNLLTPYAIPVANCTTVEGTGSCLGFTVSSNYPGTVPTGVTRLDNQFGFNGNGANTWNPRLGVDWQIPNTNRVVIRAGYGIYHSVMTAQTQLQTATGQPFALNRATATTNNTATTWVQPYSPFDITTLPNYTPYTSTSVESQFAIDPNFRSPMIQVYSMNVQTQLTKDMVLEIGYDGSHGTHLVNIRRSNQACLVGTTLNACPTLSTTVTTNTPGNAQMRVPYRGFSASGFEMIQSQAAYSYSALAVTLKTRMSHGLQFQIAYTFDKELETFAGGTALSTGANGVTTIGDQNHPLYGPDGSVRPQRFVASYVYQLPSPRNSHSLVGEVLGGWRLAGVTEIQAGQFLTITSGSTAYGSFSGTATFANGCTAKQLETKGRMQDRLTKYFVTSCVAAANPVVPNGTGIGFGNMGAGIVRGPNQSNWNTTLSKQFVTGGLTKAANVEFRLDAFNTFNHTQFDNPGTGNGTEGQITDTSVNPRILQLVLRYNF